MRFRYRLLLYALIFVSCFFFNTSISHAQEVFYVSTNGDDSWSGRSATESGTEGPFRTLTRARDAARGVGAAIIQIRGGVYELTSPLTLTSADNDTTITSYQNEEVRLVGGRLLTPEMFVSVSDNSVLNRIRSAAARSAIRQVNLRANGISTLQGIGSRGSGYYSDGASELYSTSGRMNLARWPNSWGYTVGGTCNVSGNENGCLYYNTGGPDGNPPQLPNWGREGDIFVHSWTHDYADFYEPAQINAPSGEVTFANRNIGPVGIDRRFYLLNILDEIDSPGEYYIDRNAGVLYYYPQTNIGSDNTYISLADRVISTENASNITISNLIIEGSTEYNISILGGSNVRILGNDIRNSGTYGVNVSSGSNHIIQSNDIYRTGDGGVNISAGGTRVSNNNIYLFGQWVYTYRPAVAISASGVQVSNNYIHDAPSMAIQIDSSSQATIEQNYITRVVIESGDMGAIYTGQRGSTPLTIRNNYIYNVDPLNYWNARGQNPSEGSNAIYLDDFSNASTVTGNILHSSGLRGVFVNSGDNNTVRSNLILGGKPYGIFIQYRYWASDRSAEEAKPVGNEVTCNVLSGNSIPLSPPLDQGFFNYSDFFQRNNITNNINGNGSGISFGNGGRITSINSSTVSGGQSCFQLLPISQIGLTNDEFRQNATSAYDEPSEYPIPTFEGNGGSNTPRGLGLLSSGRQRIFPTIPPQWLTLVKTVSNPSPDRGELFSYIISAQNNAEQGLTFVLEDIFSDNIKPYRAYTDEKGSCIISEQTVNCGVNVPRGSSAEITIEAYVLPGTAADTVIQNIANAREVYGRTARSNQVAVRVGSGSQEPPLEPERLAPFGLVADLLCNGQSGIVTSLGCVPLLTGGVVGMTAFLLIVGGSIAGGVTLMIIIYGGYMIMTSIGDPRKLQAGRELVFAAISGLILLIFSIFILRLVGSDILQIF